MCTYVYEKVKVSHLVLYLTLCDPMDCTPPGFSIHEILQVRILSVLPQLSPGDLPNPGIKPRSPVLQADSLSAEPQGSLDNARLCSTQGHPAWMEVGGESFTKAF